MIDRLSHFALICLCALPVWLIIRRPWRHPRRREIVLGLFAAYVAALLVMALDGHWAAPTDMLASARERLASGKRIYLTPFATIARQIERLPSDDSLTQLLGNTALFAPWGFFLPLLWQRFRQAWAIMLMCLGLTCCIEFIQLFIGRAVDVDDLILNFAGSMSGAGIWWIWRRLTRGKE